MKGQNVIAVDSRAKANLEFIRTMLSRSSGYSRVAPGPGGALMGMVALVAAAISSMQASPAGWLVIWLAAAATAATIGVDAIRRQMNAAGFPLWCAPTRLFAQRVFPSIAAGAVLTMVAVVDGSYDQLPTLWLLLYGAGVLAGGTDDRILSGLGGALMGLGLVCLVLPPSWGTACLALGFGVFNLVAGVLISRRHGE